MVAGDDRAAGAGLSNRHSVADRADLEGAADHNPDPVCQNLLPAAVVVDDDRAAAAVHIVLEFQLHLRLNLRLRRLARLRSYKL